MVDGGALAMLAAGFGAALLILFWVWMFGSARFGNKVYKFSASHHGRSPSAIHGHDLVHEHSAMKGAAAAKAKKRQTASECADANAKAPRPPALEQAPPCAAKSVQQLRDSVHGLLKGRATRDPAVLELLDQLDTHISASGFTVDRTQDNLRATTTAAEDDATTVATGTTRCHRSKSESSCPDTLADSVEDSTSGGPSTSSACSKDAPQPPALPPLSSPTPPKPASGPPALQVALPSRPDLHFGPTEQQQQLQEPPLQASGALDIESGNAASHVTVQRSLDRRESQTTDLQRQLRETKAKLSTATSEAKTAKARLQAALADPSMICAAQAELAQQLQQEISDLSQQLTETQQHSQHLCGVAKSQRLYFTQSERLSNEEDSATTMKLHPAGEIFLEPPPLPLDEEEMRAQPKDLARSHFDPYSIDSWPFEPNTLASRNTYETPFPMLEEDAEEFESPQDCDDDDACGPWKLPPQYCREDEDSEGDSEDSGTDDEESASHYDDEGLESDGGANNRNAGCTEAPRQRMPPVTIPPLPLGNSDTARSY